MLSAFVGDGLATLGFDEGEPLLLIELGLSLGKGDGAEL